MRKRRNLLLVGIILGSAMGLCNGSNLAEIDAPIAVIATEAEESQPLPFDDLRTLTEIIGRIKQAYVEPVSDKKLFEDAIRGMLSGLDPHSAYMASDEYINFQEAITGQFVGFGIEVSMENGFVKVLSPIDDSPAQKAGIKAGDLIISFDGQPVKSMTATDADKYMHGELGSKIVLTVVREGEYAPLKFALTRDIIKSKSVKYRLLEKNYGYLRISSFQPNTNQNLLAAVDALKKENKGLLNGLVLDLRNNPGGVLNDAVEVSDAFLDSGLIVFTEGRVENAAMRFNATPGDVMNGAPIVVLINGGSASASEIVAGALQDHKRAIIMGEKSFGKGTVQAILPTSSGSAIKLTIARYFTPSGRSIQAEGIVPDIKLAPMKLEFMDKPKFERIKEADLTHHLSKSNREKVKANAAKEAKTASKESDDNNYLDYPLNEALNLLKGIGILANSGHPSTM